LLEIAETEGIDYIADGSNADDERDFKLRTSRLLYDSTFGTERLLLRHRG